MGEHLWSDISQTACEGRELLPGGFEVLGTGRSRDTHVRGVSSEPVNATYMPKSATTISDPGHLSGPKVSQRDVLEIPMDDGVVVR